MSSLDRITVLGAGVLGGQIAWHSAYKGKTVVVYDITDAALDNCRRAHAQYAAIYQAELGASEAALAATRERLHYTTALKAAVAEADLVIEAVPEVPAIKTAVYQEMAPLLPAHTLIATNSSTLLPRDFAAATGRPDKYCALHYANLIWSLNLVEIMAHPGTAVSTLRAVTRFGIETGMVPIPVHKEQNGYVINSWFVPLLNAAQSLVTNGVATPEDIDRSFLIANRGCARGPIGMLDIVGMNTAHAVLSHWGRVLGDAQMLANADYIQRHLIDEGRMGLATGAGYYRYPDPAYAAPDFLDVPDLDRVEEIVRLSTLGD